MATTKKAKQLAARDAEHIAAINIGEIDARVIFDLAHSVVPPKTRLTFVMPESVLASVDALGDVIGLSRGELLIGITLGEKIDPKAALYVCIVPYDLALKRHFHPLTAHAKGVGPVSVIVEQDLGVTPYEQQMQELATRPSGYNSNGNGDRIISVSVTVPPSKERGT